MSNLSVEFIPGPPVSEYSRQAAETTLRRHASVAAGAPYALEQLAGQWVAAVVHEGEFPPAGGDEEEASPAPKSEPGGDEGASAGPPTPEDGPPSDDGGESEGGEGDSEGKKDSKGGKEEEILLLLKTVIEALGLPDPTDPAGLGAGGPDAGLGGPPGGPDAGGPPGPPDAGPDAGGPPGGGGGAPHGGPRGQEQRIIHERSLKPGEVPPGGTPVGAPAFSHVVRPDHPWAEYANKMASFHVSTELGDAKLADIEPELHALASEVGYRVARIGEARNEFGQRVAAAVITKH